MWAATLWTPEANEPAASPTLPTSSLAKVAPAPMPSADDSAPARSVDAPGAVRDQRRDSARIRLHRERARMGLRQSARAIRGFLLRYRPIDVMAGIWPTSDARCDRWRRSHYDGRVCHRHGHHLAPEEHA